MVEAIVVKGAREHNLKGIDVEIPKRKLVVLTGVSGSGKSSLAFDTLYAEGQRRYVESLSSYVRQFLGQMEKPRFDSIRGLSPTISIGQRSTVTNPRSTVGTMTEIHDYLRVLFARVGVQHCLSCGRPVGRGDAESMVGRILELPAGTLLVLLAPVAENRKGGFADLLERLRRGGFQRARIDGIEVQLAGVQELSRGKKHTIEVVVDRLVLRADPATRKRLTGSVEAALGLGGGRLVVHAPPAGDLHLGEARACCGTAYPEPTPQLFSFNSPLGMCPRCNGIGSILSMDPDKIVPDRNLSIRQGAVVPWQNYFLAPFARDGALGLEIIRGLEKELGLDLDSPWKDLPKASRDLVLHGSKGREVTVHWHSDRIKGSIVKDHEGVLPTLMRRYMQTRSEGAKAYYARFLSSVPCPACGGRRLRPEALGVRIDGASIVDVAAMSVADSRAFLGSLRLEGNRQTIAEELLKEITGRLGFLLDVGLGYLSLDRGGPTLSAGEAQRIRLASQLGSELTGVLYILDEPTIGLHPRDTARLLGSLTHLRDIGNTLIIVEHDEQTMRAADWIVDLGPGAGQLGGHLVAQGTAAQVARSRRSLTGAYLAGRERIEPPARRRRPADAGDRWIVIRNASENNLAGIDVRIPVGLLVAVTGVSGAGKSTLVNQILFPSLAHRLHGSSVEAGRHDGIDGLEHLDKVVDIDQKAIGRTPRSNPATYTKALDPIRDLFALLPESRMRGYDKGRFSFNVKGGRCEACGGDGYIRVEMHFLADVFVPCEVCKTRRFNQATLEILYKGRSIADVLDMTVRQALELFGPIPAVRTILETLDQVGLSYVALGQPATTLSGGEAQRIKLARELARRGTGRTLYILDEPTTGLHFDDIRRLLAVLHRLADGGNTVVVIEHNLDVVKSADWVVDLGPEGGAGGGRVVAEGPPEAVARAAGSHTGRLLRKVLRGRG